MPETYYLANIMFTVYLNGYQRLLLTRRLYRFIKFVCTKIFFFVLFIRWWVVFGRPLLRLVIHSEWL